MEKSKSAEMSRYRELARKRLDKNRISRKPPPQHKCPPITQYKEIKIPLLRKKRIQHKEIDFPDIGPNPFAIPEHRKNFAEPDKVIRKKIPTLFDMGELKTIIDHVHDQFFSVVDGKPIRPNADSKLYMRNVRDILQYRQNIAYLKDQIKAMDVLAGQGELETYDNAVKLYHDTVINYQQFMKDLFAEIQELQKKTEILSRRIDRIQEQLEEYSFKHITLKNQLIFLSDKLDAREVYRRFLNNLSPIWWRLAHYWGFTGTSIHFRRLFIEDSDSDMFATGVNLLKEIKCDIYWQTPDQIMKVLDEMSDQCHDYMRFNMLNLTSGVRKIFKYRDALRNQLATEMQDIQYVIDIFEKNINYFKQQEKEYETKFYKILNNKFKEVCVSYESMKLYLCIDFVNEFTLGTVTDARDDLTTLMRQVEVSYMQTRARLEELDNNIVKQTTEECMRNDRIKMKKAYEAQRTLKEWAIFNKALHASYEPPRYKYKRS